MARRVGLGLLLLLAGLLLILGILFALAQTAAGQRLLAAQIETLLSAPGAAAEVSGLEGFVPVDMRLGRLALADAEGPWLVIERARLAWSPRALLGGRLELGEIAAARIEILRLPAGDEAAPDDEPLRLPELPATLPPVSIERIAVDELVLGPAVLGEAARFRLDGRMRTAADRREATAALTVERTDESTARADLEATLGLDPARLDLALEASETGGLLAAVSGRPEAGAFTLTLSGSGPLDDWSAGLDLRAEGLAEADAAIRLQGLGEAPRMALDGELRPAPALLPEELARVVGERIKIAAGIVRTGPQALRIEGLHVAAGVATLGADLDLDLEDERIDAAANLEVAALAPLGALAGTPLDGSLSLSLTAEGALLRPRGQLHLTVRDLAAADIRADRVSTELDWALLSPVTAGLGIELGGTGEAGGLALAGGPPLPEEALRWRLDVTAPAAGPIDIETLALTGERITVGLSGDFDPEALAGDLKATLTVAALGPVTALYGERIDGRLELESRATIRAGLEAIALDLSGRFEDLGGLPPGAAELLGARTTLAASALIEPERRVRIERLTIKSAALDLAGDLALGLEDRALGGSLRIDLPRLGALAGIAGTDLAGSLRADLGLDGTLDAPAVTLEADGRDLLLAGQPVERLTLRADGADLVAAPAGGVELAFGARGLDATLAGNYRLKGEVLHLDEIALDAPGSEVRGALALNLAETLVDGEITGDIRDLAALGPLLPLPLEGRIGTALELAPVEGRQDATLALDVEDLRGEFGRLQRLDLDGELTDLLGESGIEATARLAALEAGEVELREATIRAGGGMSGLDLSATLAGRALQDFSIETAAEVALEDATTVRLTRLEGRYAGEPLRLAAPVRVTIGETLAVDGLDLAYAGARLTAAGELGAEVALDASLEALPLRLLATFGGPALEGSAAATLRLEGPADDPTGILDAQVGGLRSPDPALVDLPPVTLAAGADLSGQRLTAELRAEGLTEGPARLTVELPLVLQLRPFLVELPPDGALAGDLDARLRLARLAEVLPLDDQRLLGELSVALAVDGTIAAPRVDGTVALAEGRYENGMTGTVLERITLEARASRRQIEITAFSATDGGQGRLSGGGTITLDPDTGLPFTIELRLENATLVRRDDVEATIGGRLDLTGDTRAAELAGRITVERAEIRIPEEFGPDVAAIEVEEMGADATLAEEEGEAPSDGFTLGLDLTIRAPGQIFVRGRGLESEWEGELRATGTAAAPSIVGSLRVRRGHFDFLGKRLVVGRGVIELAGQNPPRPTIDLEARARGADITAIVRVQGPVDAPELSLDSEPVMPEDEILARLLFDRPISEISALEAASLAVALNRLRGGGGFDLLGETRELLRLDTLDVGGSEDGQRVRAGKYLADEVYVEVERGTGEKSGRAEVQLEILPSLSLEADVTEEGRSGVGIKWRYDY